MAPGYLELESGVEWDRNTDGSHALTTPTELKLGLAPRIQLALQGSVNRPPQASFGVGDVALVLKYRLADHLPILGAFAVLPGLKLPVGTRDHGTTTTDLSILLVSSRQLGAASIDLNVGYTRRSGDGSRAPRNATVWTASVGLPVRGALGVAAELFGYPRTTGPTGSPGTAAILAGPTFTIGPQWTLDLGAIVHLRGPQPDALYLGMVYNIGKL